MTVPAIDPESGKAQPVLLHNGAATDVLLLITMWAGRVADFSAPVWNVTIPSMEPGEYSLCSVAYGSGVRNAAVQARRDCASGALAPHGELTLRSVPR